MKNVRWTFALSSFIHVHNRKRTRYICTHFWLLVHFTTDITSTLPRDITNGDIRCVYSTWKKHHSQTYVQPSYMHTFTRALKRAAGVTTCQSARTPKRLKVGWDELCSQLESITESSSITVLPYRSRYGARDAHLIISLRTCVTFDPNYCPVNKEDYTEVAVITRPPRQFVSLHCISIIIYV